MSRSVDGSTVTEPDVPRAVGPAEGDGVRWRLVAGASLISTALAAYEIAPASVTPLITASLGIGATAAGLLVGVMFGMAVVWSLPTGVLLDRTDTRLVMAGTVVAIFAAGAWGWWAASAGAYGSLLASRVVGGMAFVVVWNAGIDIVSEATPPARLATVVAMFTASAPLGFVLGQGLSPLIAARWGWPTIFVAYTGIALLGLGIFWPTSRGLGRPGGGASSMGDFGAVLRNRGVWIVALLAFLGYALYLFVNSWGPSFLTTEVGVPLALSGLLVALFPAVGVVSRVGGGVLSDQLFGGRRRPVVMGSFLIGAPLLVSFTVLRSTAALAAALLVAGFAIQLMIGLSFAYVREQVSNRVAATAVAFHTAVSQIGAFAAPVVGGAVIETWGYSVAFLAAAGLAVVGVGLAWLAPPPG